MADAAIWLLSGAGALAAAQLLSRLINQRRRNTSLGQLPPTNPVNAELMPVSNVLDRLPVQEILGGNIVEQRIDGMTRKLEDLKRLQFETQRSIRQEYSALLNRPGAVAQTSERAARLAHVREGRCYVCNTRKIDSGLYRCGHKCMCFDCGNELKQGGAKCPLCRAPIVDVTMIIEVAN